MVFCVRVPRSCATENTHTPARLEALFKLSVVNILNHNHQISAGCGCYLELVILFQISLNFSFACCLQCRNPSFSRKCKPVSFSEDRSTSVFPSLGVTGTAPVASVLCCTTGIHHFVWSETSRLLRLISTLTVGFVSASSRERQQPC